MSYPYVPPQPPPKSNTVKIVLLVVGGVLVLVCAGVVTAGIYFARSLGEATGPVRTAAETFIDNLQAEDYDAAHRMLCERTRDRYPVDVFRDGVQARGKITTHEIVGVHVRNVNGELTGVVNARLRYDLGFDDVHSFPMVKERGEWKVCGQPF